MLAVGCSRSPKPAPFSTGVVGLGANTDRPGVAAGLLADASAGDALAAAVPRLRTEPVFSSPIAATRAGPLAVVAGLVVGKGIVRVMAMRDGHWIWAKDVVHGAQWAPDAELTLDGAGAGIVLVWRAGRAEKRPGTLFVLGPDGEIHGAPEDVGSAVCATEAGLAWVGPAHAGSMPIRTRAWAERSGRDALTIPAGRSPALVCGTRVVFVMGDGDDDVTVSALTPGTPSPDSPAVAIRESDFSDEEQEHEAYSVDDDLRVLRVGSSGTIAVRNLRPSGTLAPWHLVKRRLSSDDDVVAVDGDRAGTIIVFTRESEVDCAPSDGAAVRVQGLRVDETGDSETRIDLAPADCARIPGPIWIAQPSSAPPLVAWVERGPRSPSNGAPIHGLVYRDLDARGVRAGRVDLHADALVQAGCSDEGCLAAALERASDGDEARPMPISLVPYP